MNSYEDYNLADLKEDDPFNGRFIKVFEPIQKDIRISSQKSWFSIQNMHITRPGGGDGLPHFNEYNVINQKPEFEYHLAKLILPNKLRKTILNKLNKMGINYFTIFGDLTGLCKQIEWEELRNITVLKNLYLK